MTDKSYEIEQQIIARLQAGFTDSEIKSGWVAQYLRDNSQWPLIAVAPIVSDPTYSGPSIKNTLDWHIQLVEKISQSEDPITQRLHAYLALIRKALIIQKDEDRHGNWNGLLSKQPTEGGEARYIEPSKGADEAGISFVLTTTFATNL